MKTSNAIMSKDAGESKDIERPRNLEALEALLRRGQDFYVMLSASVADAILGSWNTGNRRVDQVRVQALKRDQSAGRWLAGEAIGFGVFAGRIQLGDGQHRLMAQVASGTELVYLVRTFVDEVEFDMFVTTRDSGKNRTLADLFTILHVTEGSGSAMSFERVTNAMQTFMGARPGRLSRQERLDFAFDHAKEIRYVLGLRKRDFKAHILAAIAIAYAKNQKQVEEFVAQVISGAQLPAGSPALELTKALPDLSNARSGRERDRAMGIVLRVINDGIRGRKKTSIRGSKASGSPMRDAIAEFAGARIANEWAARQLKGDGQ